MEAVLIQGGGFWDLVTGDEKLEEENDERKKQAFKKRQAQCRAEIVLRVEDSQLPHMTGGDLKTIWDALATVHHAQGFGSCLQLHQQFTTATMKSGQSIEGWIGEVHSHANKLKAINVNISDKDIIVVLTAGLPPFYTTVIISLDAVKSKELTLDFIITHLLNKEG